MIAISRGGRVRVGCMTFPLDSDRTLAFFGWANARANCSTVNFHMSSRQPALSPAGHAIAPIYCRLSIRDAGTTLTNEVRIHTIRRAPMVEPFDEVTFLPIR